MKPLLLTLLLCFCCRSEDLRLSHDGKSIEAVNVITNVASMERLREIEAESVGEIAKSKRLIVEANALISYHEERLTGTRRYIATLEAMLKMRATGTNVVTVPFQMPDNSLSLISTNTSTTNAIAKPK